MVSNRSLTKANLFKSQTLLEDQSMFLASLLPHSIEFNSLTILKRHKLIEKN